MKAPIMKRLLLLLFLPLLTYTAYAQEKLEEHWYSLQLEGKTVGFLHQTTWQSEEGLIRSDIEQTMEIRRFGFPFFMTQTDVWIEAEEGALVSVSSELDMNGQRQWVEARIIEGELRVQIRGGEQAEEIFLPLENEPRGLHAIDREIAAMITNPAAKERFDYRLFSPETMKIEEFRMRILGPGELADSQGRTHRGVLVEERSTSLPGVVTTEVYDEQAKFLYSKTPVGLALEILRLEGDPRRGQDGVSAEAGSMEDLAAVFDVASLTVPVRGLGDLSLESTRALTVLFRGPGVGILHGAACSAEEDLTPQPGARTEAGDIPLRIVSATTDDRGEVGELVLELRSSRGPAGRGDSIPATAHRLGAEAIPPELQRYLEGGFHLDLEDPRLEELLDRCHADGGTVSPSCLERLADRYIRNKSLAFGFAGLDEILESREGDCTEHALLLAALLRKAGVPSRLAYGLIMTEVGFIGHAWVELHSDARWHWLDPSFPAGRPYGLKVRLGVMDPAEPVWASLSLDLLKVIGNVEAEIMDAEIR
jgi:hypothetical protein